VVTLYEFYEIDTVYVLFRDLVSACVHTCCYTWRKRENFAGQVLNKSWGLPRNMLSWPQSAQYASARFQGVSLRITCCPYQWHRVSLMAYLFAVSNPHTLEPTRCPANLHSVLGSSLDPICQVLCMGAWIEVAHYSNALNLRAPVKSHLFRVLSFLRFAQQIEFELEQHEFRLCWRHFTIILDNPALFPHISRITQIIAHRLIFSKEIHSHHARD